MKKGLFLGGIASLILVVPQALASEQGDYYASVNAGYGQTKLTNISKTGNADLSKRASGFIGTLGFGYYLSDNIRVEAQAYYDNGLKAKSNNLVTQSRKKTMAGFLNFGCDFMPTSPVNPYILAGVGYAQHRFDLTKVISPGVNESYKITKKDKRGTAWQGGLGLTYNFTENFALDISARLISDINSKKKTCANPSNTDTETCKAKTTQAFLGGVRYTF